MGRLDKKPRLLAASLEVFDTDDVMSFIRPTTQVPKPQKQDDRWFACELESTWLMQYETFQG